MGWDGIAATGAMFDLGDARLKPVLCDSKCTAYDNHSERLQSSRALTIIPSTYNHPERLQSSRVLAIIKSTCKPRAKRP